MNLRLETTSCNLTFIAEIKGDRVTGYVGKVI
jgi:hypothetical protein